MTATDELRRLLDERGVEYRTHGMTDRTWFDVDGISWFVIERENGGIAVEAMLLTPEQAIEATLGRGECRIERRQSAWGGFTEHCSECGADLGCDTRNTQHYCPNCGRKVRA